jgi:antitoxin YefM
MEHVTTSQLRGNLKKVLDRVNSDHVPVSVARTGGREVVLVDGDDYRSIMETLHLVRSPANAERLEEGMRQHREGQRNVIDVEAYLD